MWILRLFCHRRCLVSQRVSSLKNLYSCWCLAKWHFSMLWLMLHFTLKKRFDTKWTVKDKFGVLLKFSDLIEMSRDTLKSHCKAFERNLLSTLKTDIYGAKVTENIINLPAVHLRSEQSSSLWARSMKLQEPNLDVKGCHQNFCNIVKVSVSWSFFRIESSESKE